MDLSAFLHHRNRPARDKADRAYHTDRTSRPDDLDDKLILLSSIPAFSGTSPSGLAELGRSVELVEVDPGTVLQVEGSTVGQWMHVVDGTAVVSSGGTPRAVLRGGSSWGAGYIASHLRSPESIRALEPMVLVLVDARRWRVLAARFAELGVPKDRELGQPALPGTAVRPAELVDVADGS